MFDSADYVGITVEQPKGVDLQSTRATIFGLHENRRGKILCQRRLANAWLSMQDNDRRQPRGRAYDLHFNPPGGAGPIATDLELGLKRHAEAVRFASLAGMADEDFPYLLGDLWPANSYDL